MTLYVEFDANGSVLQRDGVFGARRKTMQAGPLVRELCAVAWGTATKILKGRLHDFPDFLRYLWWLFESFTGRADIAVDCVYRFMEHSLAGSWSVRNLWQ